MTATADAVQFRTGYLHGTAIVSGYLITDTTRWHESVRTDNANPFILNRITFNNQQGETVGIYPTLDAVLAEIAELTSILRLEVSVCDERRSYFVTFEGPDADAMAVEYMEATLTRDKAAGYQHGNRNFHEAEGYPYDAEKFPRVWEQLNPLCDHGLSAHLCMDPYDHYGRDEDF